MIEPLKYLIQPVAYERDVETGRVIREMPGETITVFSADQAMTAILEFERQVERIQEQKEATNASDPGDNARNQLRQPGLPR